MVENSIILDTTYVLPLFGIEVILTPNFENEIKQLWESGISQYQLYLPSICLIETIYKLNREFRKIPRIEILKRYPLILPTIINSHHVQIFYPYIHLRASEIAMTIRQAGHPDLMDCWIAASAVVLEGILLTEDDELKQTIKRIPELQNTPIHSWKELFQIGLLKK